MSVVALPFRSRCEVIGGMRRPAYDAMVSVIADLRAALRAMRRGDMATAVGRLLAQRYALGVMYPDIPAGRLRRISDLSRRVEREVMRALEVRR